jgi:hypothetical protein
MILNETPIETMSHFGRELLADHRKKHASFESAAQNLVEELFHTFTQSNGDPMFALVRLYRLCKYEELNADVQALVDPARQRWMVLMGTYGVEAAWCDRRQSQGHKALNLGADQSPMVSAAVYQLGMDVGVKLPPPPHNLAIPEVSLMTRYFHIEQAAGSQYVPAQTPFVVPYDIESVVGIGSNFMSSAAYLLLGFSRVHLPKDDANKFAQLAPFVSTLMALYDKGMIWSA